MNCDQVARLIDARTPLPEQAREHLRNCPLCAYLAAIPQRGEELASGVEGRIVAAVTTGLKPVRPLAPAWLYTLAMMAAAAMVAAIGIRMLGSAGWGGDSVAQRSYFAAFLAAGIVVCALNISRLMVPGALLVLPTRMTLLLAISCLAAGALLYPASYYVHFWRAAAACLSIGLGYAIVACGLTFWIVRRGAFLSGPATISATTLLSALTGVLVLFVFCPHRDLGHFFFGHTTVAVAAAVLGAWIGRRFGW
jgi:Negative regulator of sigma F